MLGLAWNVAGEPVKALEVLGEALCVDPDHAESLYLLGMAAFQRGWNLEGTRAAERLVKRPGWEARADLLLGMIRAGDNNPTGAAEALLRPSSGNRRSGWCRPTRSVRGSCWPVRCSRPADGPRPAMPLSPSWKRDRTPRPPGS